MGYIFDSPRRKVVVLGDTSDASALQELAMDASILVHEATSAWMPPTIDSLRRTQAQQHLRNATNSHDPSVPYSTDTDADLFIPTPLPEPPKVPMELKKVPHSPIQSTPASVRERASQCGHSTPDMAGEFAASIRSRSLFMNHFSVKSVHLVVSYRHLT